MDVDPIPLESSKAQLAEASDLSQRLSKDKVRIQRWPSPLSPVVGPSVMVMPIDRVAECLVDSGFMRGELVRFVKSSLLSGKAFMNKGDTLQNYEDAIVPNGQTLTMQVRSEYRMATEKEVLDSVDSQAFSAATGRALSKKALETRYVLRYHEGAKLIEAYDALPRQAKVVLDILNDSGREELTEASIEMLLNDRVDELKTKQDAGKIFGFYRRRLIDEGHLEEVE